MDELKQEIETLKEPKECIECQNKRKIQTQFSDVNQSATKSINSPTKIPQTYPKITNNN